MEHKIIKRPFLSTMLIEWSFYSINPILKTKFILNVKNG